MGDLLESDIAKRLAIVAREHAGPIAIVISNHPDAFSALSWMAHNAFDGLILDKDRDTPSIRQVLHNKGFDVWDFDSDIVVPARASAARTKGRFSLLTSGSTGTPKLVSHSWRTLFTGASARPGRRRTWILPYQTGTYAWLQIATLGLFLEGESIGPVGGLQPADIFRLGSSWAADSISATPSFWRVSFLTVPELDLTQVPLRNIALGGERIDQQIIDGLKTAYPKAAISHVYASSEAGAAIIVRDGLAGFPSEWLGAELESGVKLKIEDGRLWIRSPHSAEAASGRPATWIDSGDSVVERDGRIHILGRASTSLINVGGNKAFSADVAEAILLHPAVLWCQVRPRSAPIVGNLVEADVVFKPSHPRPTEENLTKHCRGRLPEYSIPRIWNFLERIPVLPSLKSNF